ncbi:KxYKxGKxW signal peptide domain-containing protein [Leuconostoc citreum]
MSTKKYKLYKDGKSLVIGLVTVAGIVAINGVSQVSADTTTTPNGSETQAVKTTDVKQNEKQVALQPTKMSEATPQVKSDVPTSVPSGTTQDKAKETVDKAQDTVKGSADEAKKSGVEVTQKPTQDVTINQGNAVDETNRVLTDLNKQDQAIKKATAKQKGNDEAKQKADKLRDETTKQGKADLDKASSNLKNEVDKAKQSGVKVTEKTEIVTPKYQDLKGLSGQALLVAMQKNIELYKSTYTERASKMGLKAQQVINIRLAYEKAIADYKTEKARVDKVNAERKAKFEQQMNSFNNGVNHQQFMTAKTDTDASSGQYQTFMQSSVNQSTGEFTLTHDMNDGVNIIGNGELKGKVDLSIKSNGDGTETVQITSIHLYSYTYTNHYQNQAVNQDINFHVYDLNGNELFSVYHDGNSSFSRDINKSFALNQTFKLADGQKSDDIQFLIVHDNWIFNTHGKVFIAVQNTNAKPNTPTYDKEPVVPDVAKAEATYFKIIELPSAEKPVAQKVAFGLYNMKTTPVETPTTTPAPTPQVKVKQASILPHTGASEKSVLSVLSAFVGIASLSLLGAMSKFKKKN